MSKNSWREIKGGKIRCDNTGQIATLTKDRQIVGTNQAIIFTDVEWAKLQLLAQARKTTPEACIRAFVASCQPNGKGWTRP